MSEQRSPVEQVIDERLDALVKQDWERYGQLGHKLMDMVQERRLLSPGDRLGDKYDQQ